MESATLRRWLAQHGCTFDQRERTKGSGGVASVTVRRGARTATLPLVGSRKRIAPETAKAICQALGIDELPPFDF